MSLEFYKAGMNAADEIASKLANVLSEDANSAIDDMFKRMRESQEAAKRAKAAAEAEENGTTPPSAFMYDKRDYERFAVTSKQKANAFAAHLHQQGVEAIVAPTELNGQWLIEMPAVNTIMKRVVPEESSESSDSYNQGSEDTEEQENQENQEGQNSDNPETQPQNQNNPYTTPQVTTEVVTAMELVRKYEEETFETVSRQTDFEYLSEPRSAAESEADEMKRFMARNMDFLGVSIIRTESAVKRVTDTFQAGGAGIVNENKKLLNRDLRQEVDEVTGETTSTAAFKHERINERQIGRVKKAIVMGDTIIVDGKIVNNEALRAKVQSQLDARAQTAKKAIAANNTRRAKVSDKLHTAGETLSDVSVPTISSFQRQSILRQADGTKRNFWSAIGVITTNNLKHTANAGIHTVNAGIHATNAAMHGLGSVFQDGKEQRDKRTTNAEQLVKNAEDETGTTIREVASTEVGSRALRKGGVLDAYVTALNTQAALMTALDRTSIGVMERLNDYSNRGFLTDDEYIEYIQQLRDGSLTDFRMVEGNQSNVALSDDVKASIALSDDVKASIDEVLEKLKDDADPHDVVKELRERLAKHANEARQSVSRTNTITITDTQTFEKVTVTVADLQKDLEKNFGKLGIDFKGGDITREDIIKINKELIDRSRKLDINIIGKNGQVDFKLIKALSPEHRKALGVDGISGNLLNELNRKGAWGAVDSNEFGGVAGFAMQGVGKMVDNDEDTTKLMQGSQKTISYTKKTKATADHTYQAIKRGYAAHQAKRNAKAGKDGADGKAESKAAKDPKKAKDPKPFDEKKAKKAEEKAEKGLAKLAKSEKNPFAKLNKAKDAAVAKLGDTAIGKVLVAAKGVLASILTTLLLCAGIAVLIVAAVIVIILIICLIINSLMNFDPLAPMSYQDTVAYGLYESLSDSEDQWRDEVEDPEDIWENRNNIKYSSDMMDVDTYIAAHPYLEKDGDNWYINPFTGIGDFTGTDNSGYLLLLDDFNGGNTYEYSANINRYGEKTNASLTSYVATESGHTSNLKDIMGMVDVMFKMNMDEASDDYMTGTLGLSERQVWWESMKNLAKVVWNNIGEWWDSVCAFFKGEEDEPEYLTWNSISYKTLESYAKELFGQSHQQIYGLNVKFHQVDDSIQLNVGGETQDVLLTSNIAGSLGICTDPVSRDYKLMLNSSNQVVPYITNAAGRKYDLSTGTFDITLSLNNGTYTDNDACLFSTIAGNAESLAWIQNHMDTAGYADCWTVVDAGKTKVNGSSITTGWYDSLDEAKNVAAQQLANVHAGFTIPSEDAYSWTKDTLFQHKYNEKYNYSNSEIVYECPPATHQKVVQEWKPFYWTGDLMDRNGDGIINFRDVAGNMSGDTGYVGNGEIVEFYLVGSNVELRYEPVENFGAGTYFVRDIDGDGYNDWHHEDLDSDGYVDDVVNTYHYCNDKGLVDALHQAVSDGHAVFLSYSSTAVNSLYIDSDGNGVQDCYDLINERDAWNQIDCGSGYFFEVSNGYMADKTQYKVTAYAPFYTKNVDNYIRNCQGHSFSYCGGHLSVHCQGITYSITNEQMTEAGAFSGQSQYPNVRDYDMEAAGYAPLLGKVDLKEVKDAPNAGEAALSGGSDPAGVNIQGSDVANRGLNIHAEGDVWYENINVRTGIDLFNLRDIFDCDCLIDKGNNVFPIVHTESWREYEGWCADNMTLATMKATTDWLDLYNFDVPMEVDGYPLSTLDTIEIIQQLKEDCGDDFTEQRMMAVRVALDWVGRAHYSENHTDHNLISEICDSFKYDANCTAGDDEAFVRFVLKDSGVISNSEAYLSMERMDTYGHRLLPADILRHTSTGLENVEFSEADIEYLNGTSLFFNNGNIDRKMASNTEETYVMYIGTLSESIVINDDPEPDEHLIDKPNPYKKTIPAGSIITVDLNNYDNAGTVQLRIFDATSCLDLSSDKTYYWAVQAANGNADDRTYVHSID